MRRARTRAPAPAPEPTPDTVTITIPREQAATVREALARTAWISGGVRDAVYALHDRLAEALE